MNLLRADGEPGTGIAEIGALHVHRQTEDIAVERQCTFSIGNDHAHMLDGEKFTHARHLITARRPGGVRRAWFPAGDTSVRRPAQCRSPWRDTPCGRLTHTPAPRPRACAMPHPPSRPGAAATATIRVRAAAAHARRPAQTGGRPWKGCRAGH